MKLDIACSTDNNYLQHCAAMLCSVFENNKDHTITVHLLHHELSDESQTFLTQLAKRYENTIIFYDIDMDKLGKLFIDQHWHPNLSIASYYRLMLASLLNESVEKVLYLDCDIIVLGDLSPLFKIDMSEYGVAAVEDITPGNDEHRQVMGLSMDQTAFCAGVLMINLKYWREHDCEKHLLEFAQTMGCRLFMEDQDVLNHEFRGRWFKLPYKYMRTPMSIAPLDKHQKWADIEEYVNRPVIIHYASYVKPWLDISIPEDKYYWKYLGISKFPNPSRIKAQKRYRQSIKKLKIRYYINRYVRPLIPNILEMLLMDLYNIIKTLVLFFQPAKFKEYLLRRWLEKYDLI